jgi:hypothetical protein
VSIALPFMESLLPRSSLAIEKASRLHRMAVISVPFGMVVDQFHPTKAGSGYDLTSTLQPLSKLKSEFTVFSNLDHGVRGGHGANHTLLSGIKSTERAAFPDGNLTVDQRAAELVGHRTRFPSLVFWQDGMSYTRTGVRVPSIDKPSKAFRLLFVDSTEKERKFERDALASSGSILDAVQADAKSLNTELGSEDQVKLEEYFTSIRETEKKLELAEDWVDRPKPNPQDASLKQVASGARDEKIGSTLVDAWLDLMFLALQTNSSHVVSLAVGNCNWGLEGVIDSYHTLSHHGQREDKLTQLALVEKFLMGRLAHFIARLQDTKQADGTSLLSSTQVLFGSGLGSGSRHSNDNLPMILSGGGFKHGQHLDGQGKQPLCNMYLSMLQQMGAEQDSFNRSQGTLTGLA